MPQLSPMMGILVFLMTNLSFMVVILSASNLKNVLEPKNKIISGDTSVKEFRGFS